MTTTGTPHDRLRVRLERRIRSFRAWEGRARHSPVRDADGSQELRARRERLDRETRGGHESRQRNSHVCIVIHHSQQRHGIAIVIARYQAGRPILLDLGPGIGRALAGNATSGPGRRADARAFRQPHQVGNDTHTHLAHQVGPMELDRLLGGAELGSDLLVQSSRDNQLEYLPFPLGKRCKAFRNAFLLQARAAQRLTLASAS